MVAKEFSARLIPGRGDLILLDTANIEKVPNKPAQRMIHRLSGRVSGNSEVTHEFLCQQFA
jgi:hypothetical protein